MKLNLGESLNDAGRDHELLDIHNSSISVFEFLTVTGHPGKPHCAATRIVKQNSKALMFRKHRFPRTWYMTLQEIKMKICISLANYEKSSFQDSTKKPQSKPEETENQQSLNQLCYRKIKGRVKLFLAYNKE